jgi:hypothetical protein
MLETKLWIWIELVLVLRTRYTQLICLEHDAILREILVHTPLIEQEQASSDATMRI